MKNIANLWAKAQSRFKRLYKDRQSGDTIVEVMISMSVLAMVIGATYALATHSFQSALDSQYRDQAVSYSQQQLELIKEADLGQPSTISHYVSPPDGTGPASGTAFCINPQNKNVQTGNSCVFANLYTVTTIYDKNTKRFQVTTSWDSANGPQQRSLVFYKSSDSFSGSLQAPCIPSDPLCGSTKTDVPAVGVSALYNTINAGDNDTITWNTTNVKAGSCTASGPEGFNTVDANANPGTFPKALTTVGDDTFSITCKDNANNPVPGFTIVHVLAPKPIPVTGGANPVSYNSATLNGSVNPNGFATTYQFNYGTTTSYCSSTPSTPLAAGTSPQNVSADATGLTQGTVYHYQLCATNTYGPACGDDATFTTATSPPPVINNFSSNQSTTIYNINGVNRTFAIATSYATSCNINGTAEPTNGTSSVFWAYPYTTYRLTCSGPSGSVYSDIAFAYHQTQVITIDSGFLCGWMWDWNPVGCSETNGLVQVVEGKVAITYAGVCETFYEGYYGDYDKIPKAYGVYVDYNLGRDCNYY